MQKIQKYANLNINGRTYRSPTTGDTLSEVMEIWANVPQETFTQLDARKQDLGHAYSDVNLAHMAYRFAETHRILDDIETAEAALSRVLPKHPEAVGHGPNIWRRAIKYALAEELETFGIDERALSEYNDITAMQTKIYDTWLATEAIYSEVKGRTEAKRETADRRWQPPPKVTNLSLMCDVLVANIGKPMSYEEIAAEVFSLDTSSVTSEKLRLAQKRIGTLVSVYRRQAEPGAEELYKILRNNNLRIEEARIIEARIRFGHQPMLLRVVPTVDTGARTANQTDKIDLLHWMPLPNA